MYVEGTYCTLRNTLNLVDFKKTNSFIRFPFNFGLLKT